MKGTAMVNVLDHGFVRLIDCMGDDLSIVRAARVSYDADWRTGESEKTDDRLIRYLLANKHTSPFESVSFTFEIKCPIFVARQWHRHRTWSYNEVSARYTELPEEFYVPELDKIGYQDPKNRQGRILENEKAGVMSKLNHSEFIRDCCEGAFIQYKQSLEQGVPRELARSVLPLSTYTRYFGSVDLHNLLHFLTLRLHPHAQYEIRVYAEAILELIRNIVPVTINHWKELNGPKELPTA